jgi:hypothetical protein
VSGRIRRKRRLGGQGPLRHRRGGEGEGTQGGGSDQEKTGMLAR